MNEYTATGCVQGQAPDSRPAQAGGKVCGCSQGASGAEKAGANGKAGDNEHAGGCACDHAHGHDHSHGDGAGRRAVVRAVVSFAMLAVGMIVDHFLGADRFAWWFRFAWYAAAYLPVGWPVLRETVGAMRRGDLFNEFSLMSIATIGAFLIGEYPEGVAVMVFYSVGEMFQDRAVDRARRNIDSLLDRRPVSATVMRGGVPVQVRPEEVAVGETVAVAPGGSVPLDGVMESDGAMLDTSALTGESVPRRVRRGEEILSGMIVTDKAVTMTVTRPADDSAYARVLDMVQNAVDRKAPAERFIRRFARIYTPIVVGLAVLVAAVPWVWSLVDPGFVYSASEWIYRSLVFLVVSCPCALVISIPLGYFGGIGAASRKGILFKGGNYLDVICGIDTMVMDKTGTLTEGVFRVQRIEEADGGDGTALLSLLASAETFSTHPVAVAVREEAARRGIAASAPKDVEEVPGAGVAATVDGRRVLAGNTRLLDRYGIAFPEQLRGMAETAVVGAVDGRYAGYAVVADSIKPGAVQAIADLRREGISRTAVLSGDRQAIVDLLAERTGVDEAYGDLLPEDKAAYVERLRAGGARVAFMGDGINDAPVLAVSDLGVAMGTLGSDIAIETADVVIQTDDPGRLADAIRIGRRTRRIVRENIVLALGVKIAVMILGGAGLATLWEAVFADVGVALLAILNSMRVIRAGR